MITDALQSLCRTRLRDGDNVLIIVYGGPGRRLFRIILTRGGLYEDNIFLESGT